ncbi:aminodeoxychorismate synthase component I [Aliiglaciecola sp. CAU 1673]|uniref:aminodeoxychorismate synthase component I n=1 Tax=Aliiglaciecola sp. CAU 1673 TaxID=3032595 RepID=UPI0023DCB049|nr:aminodeoxychorismate synthase component I [Aliiglaciecola sp. CAU 1673]MDF2178888.1 aminodeoxychorismate synthase component I [Aliiglaciecola sp. CAU 1673]
MNLQKLNIDPRIELTQLFGHFSDEPWALLLDSANSVHLNSQADMLLARPLAHITTYGQQSHVVHGENEHAAQSEDDPLILVERLLKRYFPDAIAASSHPSIAFGCGAAGYFAYDLGRRFERLPSMAKQECLAPDMAVGIYSWALLRQRNTGEFFLASHPRYPAPAPEYFETLAKEVKAAAPFALTGPWQSNMSKTEYVQKLGRIHEYLLSGDCYQVNLAQRFDAPYEGDEWQAYLALREANKAPFSAFMRLEKQCILSISPERFLSVNQGKVQTKPIKGTRPRDKDPEIDRRSAEELLHAEKDRAENLMIVDLLRNDLSKHCRPGSVQVPHLFEIESFPAVHHLVSTVEGKLNADASALDLLRGAFPGGSITGAPKIRAMEIIEELEPHRRHIYCGSIGYLTPTGEMDTSICIRTLLCEQGKLYCWAGGGIVLDSDPELEYQETLHKVDKILPVLAAMKNATDNKAN